MIGGEKGLIFMFPCPIAEGDIGSLSPNALHWLRQTSHFIVERAKTARHFLKQASHPLPMSGITILEMSDDDQGEMTRFLELTLKGVNIGVLSEAGCPGIADPGASVAAWAHNRNIRVVPFVGPSSIFLALMASGFSGQSFAFHGYLSNKKPELVHQLRQLEASMLKTDQTQIFIETPYRNGFILETLLSSLKENTRLCIACDIGSPNEDIIQQPVSKWRTESSVNYHKRPCIYLIGSTSK